MIRTKDIIHIKAMLEARTACGIEINSLIEHGEDNLIVAYSEFAPTIKNLRCAGFRRESADDWSLRFNMVINSVRV